MENVSEMADALRKGIDENSTDAPHMSIDPDTSKIAVVGDPTNIQPTKGTYELKFSYPESSISEEDKLKMKKNEKTGDYEVVIKYTDKRIKPIYRAKILLILTEILTNMDIVNLDGYNSDFSEDKFTRSLVNDVDKISTLAEMILDVPKEQLDYLLPQSLAMFFVQIFENEPNIIKESQNFLSS